jgi:tetratricopeptide (TPR) repeat protein
MLPEEVYRRVVDDAGYYITYDGTMLYSKKIDFLREKLAAVGWIVLIEENRMRQFTRVPDRYPIASEFYSRLASGDLGFEQVAEFKVQPGLGPWQYDEHDAEPTITAFDHPRVLIYRLRTDADLEGSLTEWAERTQSNKQMPDYYIGTGLTAYRSGDWQGAAAEFGQIQGVRARFVLGNLLLRAAQIRLGDHEAARVEWKKAMNFPSTDLIRAGSALSTLGMEPEGVEFLRYTASNLPEDRSPTQFVAAYTNLGADLIERGDYVEAVTALAWATEFDSTRADTWFLLADAYRKAGGLDQAETSICTALDLEPSDTAYQTLLVNLGSDHYQQGNHERAGALFRKALKYSPQIAEAHLNLGVLYFSRSRLPEALEALKSAASISPNDLEILLSLGAVYLQSGQRDNAIPVFSRVLDLDAGNTQAKAALEVLAGN